MKRSIFLTQKGLALPKGIIGQASADHDCASHDSGPGAGSTDGGVARFVHLSQFGHDRRFDARIAACLEEELDESPLVAAAEEESRHLTHLKVGSSITLENGCIEVS